MRIVYSRHYNIGFFGLERLHPFDSRKYGRAWKRLQQAVGPCLRKLHVRPSRQVRRDELLAVHSADYLDRLRNSKYVAEALELPPVRYLPWRVVDHCVLRPMRWATMGTIIAAEEAIQCGFAVNLAGGYHHAKADGGEGFCIYSDIALAVHALREQHAIQADDRVVYVDLDAHQGNGVCHILRDDDRVFIFDMYNSTIYPCFDTEARSRIDCDVPLTGACTENEYLHELKYRLPGFLDSVARSRPIGLAIYNAGTDVFEGDQLGGLRLSDQGILERDLYTIAELRQRGIPTTMLLSGGYSAVSYRLVADSVQQLIDCYSGR
jgi:histone deacetylase 11